ncbi:MAG: hypothetical protein RPT00_11290 [Gammaproteobacteria bacterium]|jgi:hypothetical protein
MLREIPSTVYKGISFKKGSRPNFGLLRSSFIQEGLFINNKGTVPIVKPVLDYIEMIDVNIEKGNILSIDEVELSNTVQAYGNVAQISSEYKLTFEGKSGFDVRYGINLFQLVNINDQWFISSMCWDDRTDKSLLSKSV